MKTSILAGLITLVAVAGLAQTSPAPSSPTAAISGSPLEEAIFAANRPSSVKAICTASCGGSSPVSCSGTTCSAVDRNCGVLERGHVTCNGVTTYCPATCNCSEICVCAVPCSEPCTSGGGFIQECGSWGICATSCYCGGECLWSPDDPRQSSVSMPGNGCATPAETDSLRSKIFN